MPAESSYFYMLAFKSCIVEMHEMHAPYYLLLHFFFWSHAEQTCADKICVELLQRYFKYIITSLGLQNIQILGM
jgi:hypothetical protein